MTTPPKRDSQSPTTAGIDGAALPILLTIPEAAVRLRIGRSTVYELISSGSLEVVHIGRSADFYAAVFGWRIRRRGDGNTAFDDTTGEVSGTWVVGRKPSSEPGLLFYIMVDSVAATVEEVIAQGGALVQPIGAEITARIHDPAGNVIGLYQEPDRARASMP